MSVGIYKVDMQFAEPVETRSLAEYTFACWLHEQKYRCEGAELEFKILRTRQHVSEETTEESIRFEVSVFDPDGKEEKAFTEGSAREIIDATRRRSTGKITRVKLWHWPSSVVLPALDDERLERTILSIRARQMGHFPD